MSGIVRNGKQFTVEELEEIARITMTGEAHQDPRNPFYGERWRAIAERDTGAPR